jgi:hypothetical protein
MNEKQMKRIAWEIVDGITEDLLDRSGLQNVMEDIDESTRDEMRSTWSEIVLEALAGMGKGVGNE